MRNEWDSGAADVVVVGGGVMGLAAARALARRGSGVVLVERGRVGAEASWAAAGMLAPQAEADRRDEFFDLLCAGRDLYPAFADALRAETGIDIELDRTGTLYLALTESDEREVLRRYEWQSRAGLPVERLTAEEARAFEPSVAENVRAALRFPSDWQVENRRLVAALAASAKGFGVRLLTGVEVTSILVERGRARGVETSRGTLAAGAVVVAAGAWSSLIRCASVGPGARGHDREDAGACPRVEPVRGQMLCFDARPPVVRHVVYSPRGYVVPRRDGRLLAGSTTERVGYDKAVTGEGLRAIAANAQEIAPRVGGLALVDSWSGLRPRAADDWPVLGASEEVESLYYATGHYRNGILLAPLTGEVVAGLVTGGESASAARALEAFAPGRLRRVAVGVDVE
ncbi:MAG TPA: glycine oxidase ThiO [Pyrinomonadaceae bacterium]|nr:glycine oxidase ThiO [Pyrinomonadaceae bacterium]